MRGDPAAAREVARIRDVYRRRAAVGREARYSLFEPAHLFHSQSLERAVLRALRREGLTSLAGRRILDVGCGGSTWLAGLARYGAEAQDLFGVELLREALPRRAVGPALAMAAGDHLPFASETFDLVAQLTVISSVLDGAMRRSIAREMVRVLRPGGIVLWYDFTVNPLNQDVAGVRLAGLRALFPGATVCAERVTLAPPLTRLLAPRAWLMCEALQQIPWLRTHLLATIHPADGSA